MTEIRLSERVLHAVVMAWEGPVSSHQAGKLRTVINQTLNQAQLTPGSPEEEVVFRAGWERGRKDGIKESAKLIDTDKPNTVGAAIARRIRRLLDAPESEIV